jgi:hypothetical protein
MELQNALLLIAIVVLGSILIAGKILRALNRPERPTPKSLQAELDEATALLFDIDDHDCYSQAPLPDSLHRRLQDFRQRHQPTTHQESRS